MQNKQNKKCQKKFRDKISHVHTDILYLHTSFRGKRIFYVVYVKKTKNVLWIVMFWSLKIVFFIQDIKNIIFFRKLMCEHTMSICTCAILFQNFLIFVNMFSHSGFVYTREPKWISHILFVSFLCRYVLGANCVGCTN
jgi:hypothetical protein